ncbi:MAG: GNAT family acetyltransferase [Herbiconiux sp.]|nr:GNAT family acetyltransferase [Herbiconiux sp.]
MARSRDLAGQQRRLSEATWSVLTERGLPGLTLRAVAERAGCTTGLVLHAFPTKEALLLHARDLLHERTRERADAAEQVPDARDALTAVLLNAVSLDAAGRDEARVWVSYLAASIADPALAERHVAGNRSFVARMERLLGACRPEWPAERLRAETVGLVALAEGLNALSAADPETYSPAAQRAAIGTAVERMLGPASTPPAAGATREPTDPRIRPFRPDDTEAVVALWQTCGLTRPWNDPRRDIARKLTTQPELFLVLQEEGGPRILAAAMAGYDGHRGWVNYLAVDPAAQKQGLGRLLMTEIERLLEARGCPKLNLQIRAGNEAVMEFYRALGYEPDGAVSFGKRLIAD